MVQLLLQKSRCSSWLVASCAAGQWRRCCVTLIVGGLLGGFAADTLAATEDQARSTSAIRTGGVYAETVGDVEQTVERNDQAQVLAKPLRVEPLHTLARLLQAVGDAGLQLEGLIQPEKMGVASKNQVRENVVESVSGDNSQLYKGNSAKATINVLSGIHIRVNVYVGDPRAVPGLHVEQNQRPAERHEMRPGAGDATTPVDALHIER